MKNLFFSSFLCRCPRKLSLYRWEDQTARLRSLRFCNEWNNIQIKPIKATQREGAGVAGPEKNADALSLSRNRLKVIHGHMAWLLLGSSAKRKLSYWSVAFILFTSLPIPIRHGKYGIISREWARPFQTCIYWYVSRGELILYLGTEHPDKVLAICADNPGLLTKSLMGMINLPDRMSLSWISVVASTHTHNIMPFKVFVKVMVGVCFDQRRPAHHPHSLQDRILLRILSNRLIRKTGWEACISAR